MRPLYRFKNETIIDWLEITPEEQREMLTLISPEEKQRKREDKRRRSGAVPQKDISSQAAYRRSEACRMAVEGASFEEIAETLGVSIHSVNSYTYGRR